MYQGSKEPSLERNFTLVLPQCVGFPLITKDAVPKLSSPDFPVWCQPIRLQKGSFLTKEAISFFIWSV